MRIEFNTDNVAELTAVAALIASLRGVTAEDNSGVFTIAAPSQIDRDLGGVGDVRHMSAESIAAVDAHILIVAAAEKEYMAAQDTHAVIVPPLPPVAAVADTVVAPVPSTPLPPSAPVAAPSTGATVDADGLPWDNRIHSTPASLKKDGTWRGKRGLDDATRDAVTAELRAVMAAPAAGVSPATPLPPSEPPVDAATAFAAPVAAPAIEPVAPPPPPVAVVAPPPPPAEAVAPAALDFAGLMRKITGLQSAQRMTVGDSAEIAKSLGITGVRDLMHRPDLIPSFDALLPEAA